MNSYRLIHGARMSAESYPVIPEIERPGGLAVHDAGEGSEDLSDEASQIERAYQAGYEAGYSASKEAGRAEIDKQVGTFTSMLDDFVSQRKRLMTEAETAVIRLSCEIARRIVGDVIRVDETTIVEVVKKALSHLSDRQKVTIQINPDDLAILKKHEPEWLASCGGGGAVEIREDSRLKRGGCLIEGESGSVEAEIDRQIEVIEKALVETVK
jgi:flagellar biosynthesis/type III secretory pathway protein FliH